MRLLGSSTLEEEGDGEGPSAPPQLLMEVMETREQLEHCSSRDEAAKILAETQAAIHECLETMDQELKVGGGKDELVAPAIRLRYLYRIEEEARSVGYRLEDASSNPSE